MTEPQTFVAVIDDDQSVRESLPDLLGEIGFAARPFASAEEFLASNHAAHAECLILDVGLSGMSGPELLRELIQHGHSTPTIFITARSGWGIPADLRLRTVSYLPKPFGEQELRGALGRVLAKT